MQTLCQWDVQGDASLETLEGVRELGQTTDRAARYAREVIERFRAGGEGIDERLAAATQKWDLARMLSVERNAMRVAVTEMIEGRVPPKVAVNEAIEIAREYGGADSPKFVNGVLDVVLRSLEKEGKGSD